MNDEYLEKPKNYKPQTTNHKSQITNLLLSYSLTGIVANTPYGFVYS